MVTWTRLQKKKKGFLIQQQLKMSYCYRTGTYNQHPSHYVQSFSSSANFGQGEYFPPVAVDFLNWDDFFLTPSTDSVALPIQTSLSAVPLLPHSYLDIVANSSTALPVASPIPVPHAALTKAALRTMMSFDDKGNNYRISLIKKLNWHERHLQEKENETRIANFAGGSEPLKISDARTRVDFGNHKSVHNLRVNGTMNCNALVNSGNSNHTTTTGVTERSKLVIRPISPSTLMALTEPCLMAWCTALDDSLAEPCLSDYLPLQTSDYNNYVDKKNKEVYNAWGY